MNHMISNYPHFSAGVLIIIFYVVLLNLRGKVLMVCYHEYRKKKKLISKKGELKREQNNGEGEMKKIPTIPIQAEMVIIPPNKI